MSISVRKQDAKIGQFSEGTISIVYESERYPGEAEAFLFRLVIFLEL